MKLGNEYLQTGDHYYSFSLTSHLPDWENGFQFGKQANEKLQVVLNPKQYKDANLPDEKVSFSLDSKNIIISTLKNQKMIIQLLFACMIFLGRY
ncbi:MAG: hypothetical protein IPH62_19860 [Ignavibacteriae bacterium]|nr:hypothetical protein [Ignavibacteriota bacterium]